MTVRKNINRFSNFVKTGTEGYLLGTIKPSTSPMERFEIVQSNDGPVWLIPGEPYTCKLESPTKSSKLKGLKSFMTYRLTPSFNGIQVSRRYKHFDWLHGRLVEKYPLMPIPPLPEKQVAGRYEDEFIEHRMALLQLWVNKVCRHPVLSQSQVWHHFITCTDDKKWKEGKRRAEKDEYVGGSLFLSISVPTDSLDPDMLEDKVEHFGKFAQKLDDSVKMVYNMCTEYAKRMQGPLRKEYQKIGAAFSQLAAADDENSFTVPGTVGIANAMKKTSESYCLIAEATEQQPKEDLDPLMDVLYAYKGMLSVVPDMIHVHKCALGKFRDHKKLHDEGKVSDSDLETLRHRLNVISYAMLAEMHQFQTGRVSDFRDAMRLFLQRQMDYYQDMSNKLSEALKTFEMAV